MHIAVNFSQRVPLGNLQVKGRLKVHPEFCLVGGICGSPVPNRRWKVRPAQSANPMEIARLRLVAVCSRLPFEPVYPFR
jgi:hypothetical protein